MAWPDNTVAKPKPNNRAALKLLEEGYVIVSKYDVPADVVTYGQVDYPEPFTPSPGVVGDVLKRLDSQQFGVGHKNWLPDEGSGGAGAPITDAPDDNRIYGRQNLGWVTVDDFKDVAYIQDWTINAGDTVGSSYSLGIPNSALPTLPMKFMVGWLISNVGKTVVPKVDIQYRIYMEDGPGNWVEMAGISFDTVYLQTPNCVAPVYIGNPGTYRVFNYGGGGGFNLRIDCIGASETFAAPVTVGLVFSGTVMRWA